MQISEFLKQLRFELTRLHFNHVVETCEINFKREKLNLRPVSISESKEEVKLQLPWPRSMNSHMDKWVWGWSSLSYILFPPLFIKLNICFWCQLIPKVLVLVFPLNRITNHSLETWHNFKLNLKIMKNKTTVESKLMKVALNSDNK